MKKLLISLVFVSSLSQGMATKIALRTYLVVAAATTVASTIEGGVDAARTRASGISLAADVYGGMCFGLLQGVLLGATAPISFPIIAANYKEAKKWNRKIW